MIKNYQLDEVITVQRFRSQIAEHFRSVPSGDFRVLDVRMFKARAEATVRARTPCGVPSPWSEGVCVGDPRARERG